MSAAAPPPEVPEWIYPGAHVILYGEDSRDRDNPTLFNATVDKIAKASFTVTFTGYGQKQSERIYFEKSGFRPALSSKDHGGTYSNWHYRVVAKDSVEGRRLAELRLRKRSRDRARVAASRFAANDADRDDLDLIRATIIALSAHADLVLAQDTANPVHRSDRSGTNTRCGKPVDQFPFHVRHIDQGVTCPDCKES